MTHRSPITIAPYDPGWSERFAVERQTLRSLLAPLDVRIEHIGSTAVPGPSAKPIVDLMLGCAHVGRLTTCIQVVAPRPEAFVVSHPCTACHGRGNIDAQPCPACSGIGVERFYHGTKADLKIGDLITPGHGANYGNLERTTVYVYLTGTLDAATWGAELARGEGRGRIYVVEPTGTIEDDPNLTDKKFPGNPTRSYRSRAPLRVIGEVLDWAGHSPEEIRAMKDGLDRLEQRGVEPID